MKEETKSKLDELMDAYDENLVKAEEEKEKEATGDESFHSEFKKIVDEVIHPTMDEIGKVIKTRGHDYEITEQKRHPSTNAHIRMTIFPKGSKRTPFSDFPHVSFNTNTSTKTVYCHESLMMLEKPGHVGSTNTFVLEEITADIVEQEILKTLEEIL